MYASGLLPFKTGREPRKGTKGQPPWDADDDLS